MRLSSNVNNTSVPTQAIISPSDNDNILNFINFNHLGSNTLSASSAFKKIQSPSKSSSDELFTTPNNSSLKYSKIANLYLSDLLIQDSDSLKTNRQVMNNPLTSVNANNITTLDRKSVDTILGSGLLNSSSNLNSRVSRNNSITLDTQLVSKADTLKDNLLTNVIQSNNILTHNTNLLNSSNFTFKNEKVTIQNPLVNSHTFNNRINIGDFVKSSTIKNNTNASFNKLDSDLLTKNPHSSNLHLPITYQLKHLPTYDLSTKLLNISSDKENF